MLSNLLSIANAVWSFGPQLAGTAIDGGSRAAQVESAMDFLAETHGPAAVEQVRAAGTDQFTVRSFAKKDCQRGENGYICAFAVDLATENAESAFDFICPHDNPVHLHLKQ